MEIGSELDEHRDDAIEEMLGTAQCVVGDELAAEADIEHRSRLGGGAHRRQVIATLVALGELASALRDVVHDRERRASELVGEVPAPARQLLDDFVGEIEEVERELLDVEAFVVERHREREGERERRDAHLQVARRS